MNLLTRQNLADLAAERWQRRYQLPDGEWRQNFNGDAAVIYNRLVALGAHPKPECVNAAIGNQSWTRLECSACHNEVARVVAVDVTNGEYATHLCAECIIQMLDLMAVTK